MSTVVDVSIPTPAFALAETFKAFPQASVETAPVAAHSPRGVMPFVWASTDQQEALFAALRQDTTTEEVALMSREPDRALYRILWETDVRVVVDTLLQNDGSLLEAHGEQDGWDLRIIFPDRDAVSRTYETWRSNDICPTIQRINGVRNMVAYEGLGLSACQYETLKEAFYNDYYDIPRGTSLDDLATDLGISHQALSERFRRGHRNLVETMLEGTSELELTDF